MKEKTVRERAPPPPLLIDALQPTSSFLERLDHFLEQTYIPTDQGKGVAMDGGDTVKIAALSD